MPKDIRERDLAARGAERIEPGLEPGDNEVMVAGPSPESEMVPGLPSREVQGLQLGPTNITLETDNISAHMKKGANPLASGGVTAEARRTILRSAQEQNPHTLERQLGKAFEE